MKSVLILAFMGLAACHHNSSKETLHQPSEMVNEQEPSTVEVPFNQGKKWRADSATRSNVAAMLQVLSDSSGAYGQDSKALYAALRRQIDKLVQQCTMQGPAHDALHVWLEKVLKDMKEWKEAGDGDTFAILKKDVADFDRFFE